MLDFGPVQPILEHHFAITYWLYILGECLVVLRFPHIDYHFLTCECVLLDILAGIMAFVGSLKKRKLYRYQFKQFAYCHMALLVVVVQSTYLAANVFNGLIWYEPEGKEGGGSADLHTHNARSLLTLTLSPHARHSRFVLPCSMVVCNDCTAYIFGFFLGKTVSHTPATHPSSVRCSTVLTGLHMPRPPPSPSTQPLIRLSPKKTWEGFLGGFVSTIVWAFWVCASMAGWFGALSVTHIYFVLWCSSQGYSRAMLSWCAPRQ